MFASVSKYMSVSVHTSVCVRDNVNADVCISVCL